MAEQESQFAKPKFLEAPPDYTPHENPVEYSFIFSGGEKFEAMEQPDGTVRVVLEKDGKTIFNFSQLLPEGYKFVSYPYVAHLEKNTGEYIPWLGWMADSKWKHIQIGEFESPQDILGLLHEIGHVVRYELEEKEEHKEKTEHERQRLQNERLTPHFKIKNPRSLEKKLSKFISKTERDAWAYAIKISRRLQKEKGLDFKALFPNPQSLKNLINEELSSYRMGYEWLAERDPKFEKKLKRMFDRRQFDADSLKSKQ